MPSGLSPLIVEVPYLTRLAPGEALEGQARIPATSRASYPYRTGRPGAPSVIGAVQVSLGYFLESAAPQPCAGQAGLYTVPYAALEAQGYVEGPLHAARLAVR